MCVGQFRIAYENIQALFDKCLDDFQRICGPISTICLEPAGKGLTLWSMMNGK